MRNLKLFGQFLALLSGLLFFAGCQQEENLSPLDNASIDERNSSTTAYPNVTFFGLGSANELYTYRSGPPATLLSHAMITGLRDGESMLAIDIRPANRVLYGVSNMNIIYTINTSSGFGTNPFGTATAVSQTPFNPGISGSFVGFDFDPRLDIIRIVTENGQNLRISPTTGQVIGIDMVVTSGSAAINAIAYSNNYAGTAGTLLYDIDMKEGKLYRQSSNAGGLTLIGSTGLTINGEGGFDISSRGVSLAVFLASGGAPSFGTSQDSETISEAYRLYGINLRSGQATSLGKVRNLIGLAIQ